MPDVLPTVGAWFIGDALDLAALWCFWFVLQCSRTRAEFRSSRKVAVCGNRRVYCWSILQLKLSFQGFESFGIARGCSKNTSLTVKFTFYVRTILNAL